MNKKKRKTFNRLKTEAGNIIRNEHIEIYK